MSLFVYDGEKGTIMGFVVVVIIITIIIGCGMEIKGGRTTILLHVSVVRVEYDMPTLSMIFFFICYSCSIGSIKTKAKINLYSMMWSKNYLHGSFSDNFPVCNGLRASFV